MLIFEGCEYYGVNDFLFCLVLDDLHNLFWLLPSWLVLFAYLQENYFLSFFHFFLHHLLHSWLQSNILGLQNETQGLMRVKWRAHGHEYNLI